MYGNECVAANHYLLKLEKWNQIEPEDAKSLHELSLFLTQCSVLMNKVNSLNQLNPSPPVLIYSRQSQNVQSFDPSGST